MNEIQPLDQKGLRQFGLIGGALIAGLFGSILPLIHHQSLHLVPWLIATILWIWAIIAPTTLNGVYQIWMKIGLVLGWINTHLILALIFYVLIMPIGLSRRGLFHRDSMLRKLDADIETYRLLSQVKPKESMEKPF